MKRHNPGGYETCIHSWKRRNGSWKVKESCLNVLRIFVGHGYVLPYKSACSACKYYCEDTREKGKKKESDLGD